MEGYIPLNTEQARGYMIESYRREEKEKKNMENAVAIKNDVVEVVQATPATLLNIAINNGADLDRLEKLMVLQEKWEQNQARKAYHVAMASFKTENIKVFKDKTNIQYKSKYSSEDSLLNTVNPLLSKYGLSATFEFSQKDGFTVTCIITHAQGHHESVSLTGPVDTSGNKNALQQIKSTATYLRKATFEAITGIASSNDENDDDGNGVTVYISDKEKSTIVDMINAKEVKEDKFLEYMKCESIEKIPAIDFQKAMTALRSKK